MRDAHMELEIVYKGKVYDMYIRETDKVPKIARGTRKPPPQIRHIDVEACPTCGSMMFNSICSNVQCQNATGQVKPAEILETVPKQ